MNSRHSRRWTRSACLALLAGLPLACAQPVYESSGSETDRRPNRPSMAPSGTAGPQLCQPCETAEECGGLKALCLADVSGGTYCASACVSDTECPEGFLCSPVHGGSSKQCVPGTGRCEAGSEPEAGGEPWNPEPGSESLPQPGDEPEPGGSGGSPDPGSTGGTGGTGSEPVPEPDPTPGTGGTGGQAQSSPDGVNALCYGVCFTGLYTECTCHTSDPCGWSNDGFCDDTCAALFPAAHFDDEQDCAAPPPGGGEWDAPGTGGTGEETTPPCGGSCDLGYYDVCTCSAADPCGWSNDGYCDDACYEVFPADRFEDALDCGY